jgi:hypothetical protein
MTNNSVIKMLELVKQDLMLSMKRALREKKERILVTEKMEVLKVEREMMLLKKTMEKMTTCGKKALIKMMKLVMKKMVIMIYHHHYHCHCLMHLISATGNKKSTASCLNLHC